MLTFFNFENFKKQQRLTHKFTHDLTLAFSHNMVFNIDYYFVIV
jgi:hypothetical protein